MKRIPRAFAIPVPRDGNGSNTWYVRPDEGTRYSVNRATANAGMRSTYGMSGDPISAQCDGKHDAPFPAVGTTNVPGAVSNGRNEPCAFNDYRFLYDDQSYGNSQWVGSGGDTYIIYPKASGCRWDSIPALRIISIGPLGAQERRVQSTPPRRTAPRARTQRSLDLTTRRAAPGRSTSPTTPRRQDEVTQLCGAWGVFDVLNHSF